MFPPSLLLPLQLPILLLCSQYYPIECGWLLAKFSLEDKHRFFQENKISPSLFDSFLNDAPPEKLTEVLISHVRRAVREARGQGSDIAAFFKALLDFHVTLKFDDPTGNKVAQELAKDLATVILPSCSEKFND